MAARKHVQSEMALQSWDDVDAALRQIAECENIVTEQTVEMNRRLAEVKAEFDMMSKPVINRLKNLEQQLKEFADANRTDLVGKSMTMNFGKLGYRLSTTVKFKGDQEPKIIAMLHNMGLLDCITVKESINKDNLKAKGIDVLLGVGAVLSQKDEFWYETSKEQLKTGGQ